MKYFIFYQSNQYFRDQRFGWPSWTLFSQNVIKPLYVLVCILKIHRMEFLSLFKRSDFPECRSLWGNSAGNPASATATGEIPWFPNYLCLNFLSFLLAYLTCNFIIKVQCFQLTENNLIQPLFPSHGSWRPGRFATSYKNLSPFLSLSEFQHSTQNFTN